MTLLADMLSEVAGTSMFCVRGGEVALRLDTLFDDTLSEKKRANLKTQLTPPCKH